MSFRELTMVDVRELVRRWAARQSDRRIAHDTGMDRKTVGRYRAVVDAMALERDVLLSDELVHEIAQRVQARPLARPTDPWSEIAAHRTQIKVWLEQKRPLRLRKMHTLLKRDYAVEASYDTLRRFAIDEFGWRKKQTTVLIVDGRPGYEAQIDFGLMGMLRDGDNDKPRKLWALLVTLVYSRYLFVWPTFFQTTEATCEGLDAAWRFFGATARVLIPDNMKSIVDAADPLGARIVDAFCDYTQARGVLASPSRKIDPLKLARIDPLCSVKLRS